MKIIHGVETAVAEGRYRRLSIVHLNGRMTSMYERTVVQCVTVRDSFPRADSFASRSLAVRERLANG